MHEETLLQANTSYFQLNCYLELSTWDAQRNDMIFDQQLGVHTHPVQRLDTSMTGAYCNPGKNGENEIVTFCLKAVLWPAVPDNECACHCRRHGLLKCHFAYKIVEPEHF